MCQLLASNPVNCEITLPNCAPLDQGKKEHLNCYSKPQPADRCDRIFRCYVDDCRSRRGFHSQSHRCLNVCIQTAPVDSSASTSMSIPSRERVDSALRHSKFE